MVVKHHDKGKKYAEDTIFKQSDWGEDAAEQMGRQYRDLKTTYGYNLGHLMEKTPKGTMSKVMLEEKVTIAERRREEAGLWTFALQSLSLSP